MSFETFAEQGYSLETLPCQEAVVEFNALLVQRLRDLTQLNTITLENFHEFITDDEEKVAIQYDLSKYVWDHNLHYPLIERNQSLFQMLAGLDIEIQTRPHLRIARPGKPQDNIGFHRDSFYGNSAYEVSCFFALVALNEKAALQIEPGSHKRPDIYTHESVNPNVKKGDVRNQLGVPYRFHIIDADVPLQMHPIPMDINQVLCLSLGTVHGQEVNHAHYTRFSIDIRLRNAFAPKGQTKEGYYSTLFSSPMTLAAKEYYHHNAFSCNLCGNTLIPFFTYPQSSSVSSDCRLIDYPISIAECTHCNHLQKFQTSSYLKKLQELYKNYNSYSIAGGKEQLKFDKGFPKARSMAILESISNFLPDKPKILDIGSGSGVFLEACSQMIDGSTLFAQDINNNHIQKIKNIKNFQSFFECDPKEINEKFDVISLIHVLEHVSSPRELMATIATKLHQRGIVLIQVPDIDTNPFDLCITDHISHFNRHNLLNLLREYFAHIHFPKKQLDREITIVASNTVFFEKSQIQQLNQHVMNITFIQKIFDALLATKEDLAIFGTAPTSTFFAGILGNRVVYFIDEDPNKIDKTHLGKLILAPSEARKEIKVILPFGTSVAEEIKAKLTNLHFVTLEDLAI